VKVNNAICTDDNYQANYYMWAVDDGSGDLKIHNTSIYEYEPVQGSYYDITGPMNYDFDEWKIELSPGFPVSDGTDTEGPQVAEVVPVDGTNIRVIFTEEVDAVTSQDVANYVIANVVVEAAVQHTFNKTEVNLTVAPLNGEYELSVQNVEDVAGNVMEPQTIPFSYLGIEEYLFNNAVSIYPNPATEQINVAFISHEEFSFELIISDLAGRQVIQKVFRAATGDNVFSCDVNGIQQGIYLLSLRGQTGAVNHKIIIR
jgi:hypothetical protein